MKELLLDCSRIEAKADLHLAFANLFPSYQGRDLDALYEYLSQLSEDTRLLLQNWHHLEYRLGDYSGKALYVFHCALGENPHLRILLEP